jgi:hypothetical protein
MILISTISIVSAGFVTITALVGPPAAPIPGQGNAQIDPNSTAYKMGRATAGLLMVLINVGVIAGGIQMIRLRGWNTARGGAVAACVPCFSALCLNVPFGIWALIVLFQPDVRRMFK